MAYFVASLIAIVSAMIIMLTRYEADDSSITSEIEHMKEMFIMVDGFVNTYIESGATLETIHFTQLNNDGILFENTTLTPANGTGTKESTISLPNNDVIWQIIPNIDEDADGNRVFENSSYKLLVDFRANRALMAKARFSESFIGREYCENMLFGTFQTFMNDYDNSVGDEDFIVNNGANNDGLLVCVVFK